MEMVKNDDGICRDFIRNVCHRGNRCKFVHKFNYKEGGGGGGGNKKETEIQDSILFCHDYQNKGNLGCPRSHCRFIHCSKSEEEEYRNTGYLPPLLRDQVIKKGVAPDLPAIYGFKPVCKDYLKGECSRNSCKFRHLNRMQYDFEISKYSYETANHEDYYAENNHKRKYRQKSGNNGNNSSSINNSNVNNINNNNDAKKLKLDGNDRRMLDMLQQDNLYLKQRVDDLKKQVDDLSTTNNFLLNQNAQLRLGVKTSQATTSIVSVTDQGQSQGQTQGQPLAVSMQGLSSIGPTVASITYDGSVRIPSGSTVSIGPPPPPSVGVAPPPVSLNQCQSLTPTGALNAAQSQTLAPPTVTVAPLQLPPTVSLAPNTALVQETRLVSYPITSILPPM